MRTRLFAAALACMLTACGGAEGVAPNANPGTTADGFANARRHTTIRLRIREALPRRHRRSAHYLSPSTQSLVYVITGPSPATTVVGSGAVNLTIGSSYCSSSASQPLTCTAKVPVSIPSSGNYTFNVATYDATQSCGNSGVCSTAPCTPGAGTTCAGNVLSDQVLVTPLTIGGGNAVTLSLGGVATSVTVTPLKIGYLRGDVLGLKLYGTAGQQVAVVPRDADGNAIVGVGAPTIAVTIANTADVTVTPSHATGSGVFTLTTGATTTGATTLSLQLTAPSDGGGVPSTNPTVVPIETLPILLVAGLDCVVKAVTTTVNEAVCGSLFHPMTIGAIATAPARSIRDIEAFGIDTALPGIDVFTVKYDNTFTVAALNSPAGIAVDRTNTLYIANNAATGGFYTVVEVPGFGGTSAALSGADTGLNAPTGVALDAFDTLYVANAGTPNSITEYAYGSLNDAAPTNTISGGLTGLSNPQGIAIDASGTIYVANEDANTVTEYAATASGNVAPIATISGLNAPVGVAVDIGGAICVANSGSNTIAAYAPGATGNATPVASITGFGASSTGALGYLSVVPAAVQP